MFRTRIVVLSDDDSIFERMRSAGSAANVYGLACLTEALAADTGSTLIIDPGAVHPCCLDRLSEWARQRPIRQVIYLCLPAPPGILFSLPHVHPGKVAELREVEALLSRNGWRAPARSAWREMGRFLVAGGGDERRQCFLSLMRIRPHRGLTAAEAAAALGVGARHLSRLVRQWFGFPPRVILGLFRVECLARDLQRSDARLTDLASMHGYTSRQGMSRHFQAYTGLTPGAYRLTTREERRSHLRSVPAERDLPRPRAGAEPTRLSRHEIPPGTADPFAGARR